MNITTKYHTRNALEGIMTIFMFGGITLGAVKGCSYMLEATSTSSEYRKKDDCVQAYLRKDHDLDWKAHYDKCVADGTFVLP